MEPPRRATLSIAIITLNEERNLARTLASVAWADDLVVVDSGSTDGTEAIARAHGARFIREPWGGFAAQKNLAIGLCTSEWVLSLDADEVVTPELAASIHRVLASAPQARTAYSLPRRNHFLGRWIRHGGYYPDAKLRLLPRGLARFTETPVHETVAFEGRVERLSGDLLHDAYPTLTGYLEHMQRYSTLGAGLAVERGRTGQGLFWFLDGVLLNPLVTFFYNYVIRLGMLDGREGLLLHLYHSCYVSWKYAKAWERARPQT
ncbi:MAG: glycosyltransferase family 2 protein [Acidobacteriaceae bacterium]|nr:glycosyltransferase family 2 protein [Acidobacteriaceae bacterium]